MTELQAELAFVERVANANKPQVFTQPERVELDFDLPEFAVQRRINNGDLEGAFDAAYALDPHYASVNHVLTVLYPHDPLWTVEAAHFLASNISEEAHREEAQQLIAAAQEAYKEREQTAQTIAQIALDQV